MNPVGVEAGWLGLLVDNADETSDVVVDDPVVEVEEDDDEVVEDNDDDVEEDEDVIFQVDACGMGCPRKYLHI